MLSSDPPPPYEEIFISFMTNDFEHLLMCLFAIFMSSLMKCLFKSFCLVFIGLIVSYYSY